MPLILKYLELEMLLVSWKLCSLSLFPYSWHTTWHWFQVHNTGSPHLWRSGSAHHKCGCHLSPYNAICQKSFFFFFLNRGLRRERKDSARTFPANCVYYCRHFAHFSFPGVKLRKLKWFPKYLVNFCIQRLKTIAGKCWNKWQESKKHKRWAEDWPGLCMKTEHCSQPPPLRASRADYHRKWR